MTNAGVATSYGTIPIRIPPRTSRSEVDPRALSRTSDQIKWFRGWGSQGLRLAAEVAFGS